MKLKGTQHKRLECEGSWREQLYIDELQQNIDRSGLSLFKYLLTPSENYKYTKFGDDTKYVEPSKRDIEIITSVIQWLGTNVGQCFVQNVQDKISKKYKINQRN